MHSDLIHWSVNIIVTANRLHCRIVSDRIAAGRSVSRHVLINPLKGRDVNWLHFAIQI